MIFTDDQIKDLKVWVVKKLEDISDADSDVLADYVLALVRADNPEPELRANAIENLEDFLRENTTSFVDQIFATINTKSYRPGYTGPVASAVSIAPAIPTGPSSSYKHRARGGPEDSSHSRKRAYHESQDSSSQGYDPHYSHHDRSVKHTRRGGMPSGNASRGTYPSTGRDGFPPLPGLPQHGNQQAMANFAPGPNPLQFDPNDPMAAIMAMQALGIPMPPLPPSSSPSGGGPQGQGKNRIDARCRDYDTKGFCMRGVACPFNHGDNQVVVPSQTEEYDPKNAGMIDMKSPTSTTNGHTEFFRGRNARGRGDRAGNTSRRGRAEFSMSGPNFDRSNSSIVVEQIPEENFEESQVRDFFSPFGSIEKVDMQPYKRLAIVEFSNHAQAKAAYDSPRVIFDNRFVKVYWYKPNTSQNPTNGSVGVGSPTTTSAKPETPAFDKEKFERDSIAAQKKLEERKALQEQTEAKLAEIEKQRENLVKRQAEEKERLEKLLSAKNQSSSNGKVDETGTGTASKGANLQTEALRAQLKALEDEAKSLGIDPERIDYDSHSSSWRGGRGRGGRARGSYRGWEGFAGRGNGGYRSRGAGAFRGGPIRGGGAFNLDNRPKTVRVGGVEFDGPKDESLRQHLFSVGEFSSVNTAEDKMSVTISFKDRFTAEKFFYGSKDIAGVGSTLDYSWVPTSRGGTVHHSDSKDDVDMGGLGVGGSERDADAQQEREAAKAEAQDMREMDYDVAEDVDGWT